MAYDFSEFEGANNGNDDDELMEYDTSNPFAFKAQKDKKKKERELSASDSKYFKSLQTRYRGDETLKPEEEVRDFFSWIRFIYEIFSDLR
ncbi:hypothetical protein IJT17_00580 [bacterium]|nr:hypothetical protein [bacterium]